MKVGILTINDNDNYGNRLQNYAVQQSLSKMNLEVETIKNSGILNVYEKNIFRRILRKVKFLIVMGKKKVNGINNKRYKCFRNFNKNIKYNKKYINPLEKKINAQYDMFFVGSDQVWNTTFNRLTYIDLLGFADPKKRIAFSASFGISELPQRYHEKAKKELLKFKSISVREDAGKRIVEGLTQRNDIEVLVDPTMLLSSKEWDKVAKKPNQLKTNKYILNYFLGELSEKRKNEINRIAKENGCEVINILDNNSPFYETGPSEFIYLEKNAFLICTDSFHSSVFAILYNRPFIVFDREDKTTSMNSRIETLINKFDLQNRKFEGKITKENLHHDYTEAYKILEKEREKSINFLKKALDIE